MGINPPELSLTGQIIISILVGMLVIVATFGNLAVIYLLNGGKARRRYRTAGSISTTTAMGANAKGRKNPLTRHSVTCIFLLNLSVADLLHILICAPFTLIADVLLIYWPFGSFLCRFVNYIQGVVVFLCAFTHVVLSMDRLAAIHCPIWRRRKLSSTGARFIVFGIWLCAMAIPIPSLIVCQLVESGDGLVYCQEVWPGSTVTSERTDSNVTSYIPASHGNISRNTTSEQTTLNYTSSPIETAYNLTSLVFQYLIPLIVITVTYSAIVFRVWGSTVPGEGNAQRDEKRYASKKRLIKMVITVATLYAVSQLPRHIAYLVTMNSPRAFERETMMYVWLFCHLCTWSATCYNPFIYAWMNRAFRHGLYELLVYWLCCSCCSPYWCLCGRGRCDASQTNGTRMNGTQSSSGRFTLARMFSSVIRTRTPHNTVEKMDVPDTTIEFTNANTHFVQLESAAGSDQDGSDVAD